MQILITERNDITPLLRMDWMKKFELTIGNIRTEENNQSERKRVIEKFPDLFKNNTTIKDTEINIQLKPGHYPVKQKARPIPLHLQKDGGKELERLIKTGHLEKVKHVDEDCFVSPVVITVKNDKSVKIALDSRKLNDSCIKIRPHMPNMEELLNQISVEITRDRTKELMMSKIDLDYAYGQMKISKETSRQCVFAITGGKFSGYYRFKKGFYGLAYIPTIFQEKIDRTLEYCTPAWLADIIVVTRGDRKEHEKKLFDVLKKLEDAGYQASERKSEFFLKSTKWLGHEIDETGIKPNKEKVKAILELKHPENQKQLKSFLGAIQYLAKFLPRLSEKTDRLRKLLKKDSVWNWGKQQDEDFNSIKEMLTEEPCLVHYAKDRENIVTTDASKTGLGITLWQKQSDGEIKPIAFGSRYLNDSEKNYSIGELELLAVVWGLEKFRFYLYGKKVFLFTDHQALEPLIKRNRCNRQYSARLTRWLDRLAHFDIAIQHIAGSNLKFTDFLSRNPVESASNEDVYDEQYVIIILSEHAELNVKYGTLFTDQSQVAPEKNKTTEEHFNNQSHQNRIFENNRDVNKMNKQTNSAPNKRQRKAKTESSIRYLNSNSNQNSNLLNNLPLFRNEMDRDYFHWGATAEIMEIIRRRRKSPETLRLVERRLEISRPGTMRRKFDMNAQRQIRVPSRPNKRSRQEIAEIDVEWLTRANRFGGGYQPLEERMEETQETPQPEMAEETEQESEGESQVIRGDNFPIVDIKAYNTEGKEAQFIQINQIIKKATGNQKNTEETIKKAEFNFMLDLKTLIAKSSTDADLNRVRDAMRRGEKNTAPEDYRANFEKLNNKWGLTFNDDRIVVPAELRKKLLDTLHFGHAGTTKISAEAKIFWWPNMQKEIEVKTKNCVACMSSGKNLKYQLPKPNFGKLKTLTEPGQEIQIDFSGKLNNKNLNGDHQILIAIDRFSKWPTAKICKSSETKEVINFLKQNFNLYGLPEKIKTDKGEAFVSKEYKEFCKSKNIEIEYSTPRMHTGTGAVERAIQTLKNLIIANLEDKTCLTECVNKALNVMRFTIHTGLKITPFELHHGRKPRTELTNIIKDGKTFLSKWSELTVSANNRPKIPIYVTRNGEGEVSNHLIMARTKTEEKAMTEKSPKKKNSVGKYPFQFFEKKP